MAETTDAQAVFEREPIVAVFSNPANVKIIATLNSAAGGKLPVSDIVDQADISRQAFYDNRDMLVEYGLIEEAKQVGNASTYRVDMASDEMQAFMTLRDTLIDSAN